MTIDLTNCFSENDLMQERWVKIDELEKFWVSNIGRIRYFDSKRKCYKVSIGSKNGNYLSIQRNKVDYSVHRIVAKYFVDSSVDLKQKQRSIQEIDHIDTNPTNNRADNLRVVSGAENSTNELTRKHLSESLKGIEHTWLKGKNLSSEHKNKIRNSLQKFYKEHPLVKPLKTIIVAIDKQGNEYDFRFPSEIENFLNNGKPYTKMCDAIIHCIKGDTKSAYGYQWKRLPKGES